MSLSNSSSSLSFSFESESLLLNLGADLFPLNCADLDNNSMNFCAEFSTYKASDDSEFQPSLSSTRLAAKENLSITDGGSLLNRVDNVLHFAL